MAREEAEILEEIAFHLDMRTRDREDLRFLASHGHASPGAARRTRSIAPDMRSHSSVRAASRRFPFAVTR